MAFARPGHRPMARDGGNARVSARGRGRGADGIAEPIRYRSGYRAIWQGRGVRMAGPRAEAGEMAGWRGAWWQGRPETGRAWAPIPEPWTGWRPAKGRGPNPWQGRSREPGARAEAGQAEHAEGARMAGDARAGPRAPGMAEPWGREGRAEPAHGEGEAGQLLDPEAGGADSGEGRSLDGPSHAPEPARRRRGYTGIDRPHRFGLFSLRAPCVRNRPSGQTRETR